MATKQTSELSALDCAFNQLLYNASVALVPSSSSLAFDSLQLATCHAVHVPPAPMRAISIPSSALRVVGDSEARLPSSGEFSSLHSALAWRRAKQSTAAIVLSRGLHFLGADHVTLNATDSGLHLIGEPGAVLSGGAPLRGLKWSRPVDGRGPAGNVWVTKIPRSLIKDIPSLFTYAPHRRLTRARFPNGDIETVQWGYASPRQFEVALPGECRGCAPSTVDEWLTPPGALPRAAFEYVNFSASHNPSGAVKRDSAMARYNAYGSGRGGLCDQMWDTASGGSGSYWCGNNTAGGWAEVDATMASQGERLLPIGMRYNASHARLARFRIWANATGAVVRAWHPQSWALHFFRVGSHDVQSAKLSFDTGGSQGGRVWCRCDQCSYVCAAARQGQARLASGSWFIEGVREELDTMGEWFFNASSRELYLWPNNTDAGGPPPDEHTSLLVAARHRTLIHIGAGARDVRISGVSFRDAAPTHMEKWGVPSGGDWALYHGGAVHVEDTERTAITECTFERLEGTGVFIGGRNRNVSVTNSSFAWLGDSAIALWGHSDEWNATGGAYPRGTSIHGNLFRELGVHEKQSSAVFIAKSALTSVRANVMFNLPRAAININDGAMGGHDIANNVIFNTCRESGGAASYWIRRRVPLLPLSSLAAHVTCALSPLNYELIQWNVCLASSRRPRRHQHMGPHAVSAH